MEYISRHFEKVINYALKQTKVVLIIGPRQVGKTKIITECYRNYNDEYTALSTNVNVIPVWLL